MPRRIQYCSTCRRRFVAPSLQVTVCMQCPKQTDVSSGVPVAEGTENNKHEHYTSGNSSSTNSFRQESVTGLGIHTNEISPRIPKRPRPDSPTATVTTSVSTGKTTATTSSSVSVSVPWKTNDAMVTPSLSAFSLDKISGRARAAAATTSTDTGNESVPWRNNDAMATPSLSASSLKKSSTSESATIGATSTEDGNESAAPRFGLNDTLDGVTECFSESQGSEGGDDLHCTQIVDLFDDDSEDDNDDNNNNSNNFHSNSQEDDNKLLIHWRQNKNGYDEGGATSETIVDLSEDEPLSNFLYGRQEPPKKHVDHVVDHESRSVTLEATVDLSQDDEPSISLDGKREGTSETVNHARDEPLVNQAGGHEERGATLETTIDLSQDDEPLVNLSRRQEPPATNASSYPDASRGGQNDNSKGDNNGSTAATIDNDMSTCFVCGVSLTHITTGMKGRLNHVKRCSKKHGVTARDVRFDDDYELFTSTNESEKTAMQSSAAASSATATAATNNPYKRISSWHGNDVSTSAGDGSSKQAASAPAPPSVFNMLMAGARRAAKTAQIKLTTNTTWQQKKGQGQWGNRPRIDYTKRACPDYKKIPSTDFVCDGFQYARTAMTQNHFLTHFHSDHYGGITKAWNSGTIYCSEATANLVNQQLGIDRKWLHPLPMLTPVVVESRGKPVTVTLLDANHCPGAVMFLFEIGSNKSKKHILHVGDFRWNTEFMMTQAPLRPFARGECLLDEIFLDTTYCDPKYTLPSQKEAIEETIKVAKQEVARAKQNKSRILMLFGAYTIGKERIYLSVAESLGMKVYVDKRRFRILSALGWPEEKLSLLTTRAEESNIWVRTAILYFVLCRVVIDGGGNHKLNVTTLTLGTY